MIVSSASRAQLDAQIDEAEPHLRPIMEAVRHHKVGLMFVSQGDQPFRLPPGRSRTTITVIGDDFHCALGPEAFHMPSLRRIIRASYSFAVVSCEALEDIYDAISLAAVTTRRNVLLIETQPEHELAWVALIAKLAPGRPLTIGTVREGEDD
ncbi:MAG: hypothetical protein QM681_11970 [Novosphingobium sp.]